MAVQRRRAATQGSPGMTAMVSSKLSGSEIGRRMYATGSMEAWIRLACVLALIIGANAAPTARSDLWETGEGGLREVTSRRNCSTFRDPVEGISLKDYWIYKAFGGGYSYVPADEPKFEFSWALVTGSIIAALGSAMGSVGGVGGGGFYLPMLNVVMRFTSTVSVALSKAMVMGVAISAVIFNIKTKHPTEPRAVINYEFALLFQPMILLGISTGVILNTLLPDWLVTLFLVILFTKLVISTLKMANELAAHEKQERDIRSQESSRNAATNPSNHDGSANGDYVALSSPDDSEKVTWKWLPRRPLIVLFLTWILFLAFQILKTNVRECSFFYWIANVLQVPVALGITIWEAFNCKSSCLEDQTSRVETPPSTKESEVRKRGVRNFTLSLLGLLAGVSGGLLGVGGGGILGPAFLELGLIPQESSSTASFIMVFSSSLSVVEYFFLNQLPGKFAIYFITLSVIAAIFGQVVIKKIVQASGRTSIIVYILASCVFVGNITLGILGVITSIEQWEAGENTGLQPFCKSQ